MPDKSPFTEMNTITKKIELESLAKGELYPVTIVMDRYGGVYSNAKWLAIQCDNTQVPDEIWSDDGDEMNFWRSHKDSELPIGKGETPNEALEDLKIKAKKFYESW
jgi:hypothetical protein